MFIFIGKKIGRKSHKMSTVTASVQEALKGVLDLSVFSDFSMQTCIRIDTKMCLIAFFFKFTIIQEAGNTPLHFKYCENKIRMTG